jgi:hypothetical protein
MAGQKTFYLVHSAFLYSVLTLSYGSITSSAIGSVCWGSNGGVDAHSWESIAGPAFAVPCEHHTRFSDKIAYVSFNLTPAASTRAESPSLCFQRKLSGSVSCVQRRHRHALVRGLLHHRRIGVGGFLFVAMDFAIIFGIEGAMLGIEVLRAQGEDEAVVPAYESGGVISALRVDHALRE